jgi:tricorn protease
MKMRKKLSFLKISFILLISLILNFNLINAQNIETTRLLRFPNAAKAELTFNYAGNIYISSLNGGFALKLTSSAGIEQIPRFSPDGKTIAFIGNYDGNPEIYTISTSGGTPKRITFSMDAPNVADRQGPDKIIMQWTKDGKNIIYRSRKDSWNILTGKLYKVAVDGGLPTEIPVPRAGFASFSPDETKMAYNRIFREFRTWKRYRGGQADEIWIYDFTTKKLQNITNNPAQDIIPMWAGEKIYFLSDRDKTMNLFCYEINSGETRKVTNFSKYDVKFPSLGSDYISFENGGSIYTIKLSNEEMQIIDIKVIDDFIFARNELIEVKNRISNFEISPDGKQSLFSARGEIFIVPANNPIEKKATKNLTNSSGIHERNPIFSPKGDKIAYISDKINENNSNENSEKTEKIGYDEVWIMQKNGENPTQLTSTNSKAYRYELVFSPDGKKLLNSDNARNLTLIDVEAKTEKTIFKSKTYAIRDFKFSPDGKWIAFSCSNEQNFGIINLYSVAEDKNYQVTSDFYSSENVEFSQDGKYLFFVSDRNFNAKINKLEWNFAYLEMSKIYGICLQKSENSPFLKFAEMEKAEENIKSDQKAEENEKINDFKIDIENVENENLENRIFALPIKVANYGGLTFADKKLYYVRQNEGKIMLCSFDFDKLEETEIGEYSAFSISPDGKNIMFRSEKDYFITKLTEKLNEKAAKIDLSGLKMNLNRKEEWTQVFNESWRHFEQFFYDSNMHGVDWNAIREKYAELLPYVSHRNDLTYLIGEMIGELNAGHAYVTGGEMPEVAKIGIGLLGIDLELEEATKMYKIKKILQGQNWDESLRSPLTEPGLNLKEGGYILAIDGNKLTPEINPYSYLVGKSNSYITLTINNVPNWNSPHDINIKTISNESELRYFNWVEERRQIVDSLSGGKIGYVHIPDMAVGNGLNWFSKYFYPQVKKEGLIIDDRFNGGGNVSPMLIERLNRELVMAKIGRNSSTVGTIPSAVMTGPMVCLINEQSMSDGDMFPFQFKELNLGTIIGKRSWGGVVGIYGSLPLLDGSSINKPEVANFGAASGNWELEGVGMTPDFEVDNHPAKEYEGIDEQLIFGINKVLELIPANQKTKIPEIPQYPEKN